MPTRTYAVFGDVHGHLRLMFQLARLWQVEHGVQLDGILQCGDLGYFPDLDVLDKATRRFAREDPEELGFWRCFRDDGQAEPDELLEGILFGDPIRLETVTCPVIWCNGNHEDFSRLAPMARRSGTVPVDVFGRLHWLSPGASTELGGLRISALGGAAESEPPPRHQPPRRSKGHRGRGRIPEQSARLMSEHFKEVRSRDAERLIDTDIDMDVLLTHCGPRDIPGLEGPEGSELVAMVVASRRPRYQFFGHHGGPIAEAQIGPTRCVWLDDVNFEKHASSLVPGCMGILRWAGSDDHDFSVLAEPWMHQVRRDNWPYLRLSITYHREMAEFGTGV